MRGKSHHAIIRLNKTVNFLSDDGRSIALTVQDCTRRAYYMLLDGKVVQVQKAASPIITIDGVTYKYVQAPKAAKSASKTVNAADLSAELKKLIGKDAGKLAEVGKQVLAALRGGNHGDRMKIALGDGFELTIAKPAYLFRRSRKTPEAA